LFIAFWDHSGKDYFIYSQLAAPTGGAVPVATHRVGDEMAITEETASDWASAIGAVTVGEMAILEPESHISGRVSWDSQKKGKNKAMKGIYNII